MRQAKPHALKGRLSSLMIFCGAFAATILSRAAYIQVMGDPRLENMAKRQFSSKMLISPRRGTITDRNGKPLAVNVEIQSLAANPVKTTNISTLSRLLSKALGIPQKVLLARLRSKREFVWIKRHLTDSELNALKKYGVLDHANDLSPGLWMVNESQRVYPHDGLAAHLLGSVNLDSEGLEGVELWADARLKGNVVSVSAVRDALGRPAFMDSVAASGVKNGESVQLTIDASLQFAVEQELKTSVEKSRAIGGSVIVMNAVNGEILAMANEPSFNPNQRSAPAQRRNRAVTDGYEPGSTMKALLLAGALKNGSKLTDLVYGEKGSWKVQGRTISEAESHERFEWISLKRLLQVSSNIGAAKLALKLGPEKYLEMLQSFGIGQRSGMGFPGEISGMLPAHKRWQPLTTANIGFGHGVLVTPIQMTRAYASIFNGGWLVQPNLLKTNLAGHNAQPPKRILSTPVTDDVVQALLGVTEGDGTGLSAALDGYRVAGKTGTAQKVDSKTGRYSKSAYIASFIGSAVGVEPKLVIFASLDEPRTSIYAAQTAAPLFRAVLNAAVTRFSIPAKSEPGHLIGSAHEELRGGRRPAGQKAVISDRLQLSLAKVLSVPVPDTGARLEWQGATEAGEMKWKMPSLVGLTPREAMRMLDGKKFAVQMQGIGVIRAHQPEEGHVIQDGGVIKMQLGEP